MNKALLYHASIAVCGGTAGVLALSSMLSGGITIVSVLLAVGGTGMFLGAVYEGVVSADPSDSVPDDRVVWFVVSMAALAVVAWIWSAVA